MANRRELILAFVFTVALISVSLAYQVHLNTIPQQGPSREITLHNATFVINSSRLSSIMGRSIPVAYYIGESRGDLNIYLEYRASGSRNVFCNEVDIGGRFYISVFPSNKSVAVSEVLILLDNESPIEVDNLFPRLFGVMHYTTPEGFVVDLAYLPNYTLRQAMKVRAAKPTWGVPLEVDPYAAMTIWIGNDDKKDGELSGNTTLIIRVKYLIQNGYFSSEERILTVKVPMRYVLMNLNDCKYG
ncbi:hypothetical protein [Thermococcus sp.]|uniref:hypothetical protein n=1 Tax=Thermococcus sp. TaxID=35749 RepID=UPI002633CE1A|nr:hypothetical protein [Thermococcus sp.]